MKLDIDKSLIEAYDKGFAQGYSKSEANKSTTSKVTPSNSLTVNREIVELAGFKPGELVRCQAVDGLIIIRRD